MNTYDDGNGNWSYTGSWAMGSGFSGAYSGTLHYTGTMGDMATFVFNGSQFKLSYTQDVNRGKMDVYVDGDKVGTINANGAFAWQETYTSPVYLAGTHVVQFKHAGGGGAYIDVDAIDVN